MSQNTEMWLTVNYKTLSVEKSLTQIGSGKNGTVL